MKYDMELLRSLNEEYKHKKLIDSPNALQLDEEYKTEQANRHIDNLVQRGFSFEGKKILEIGTGGGHVVSQLAQRYNCSAVGIDIYQDPAWIKNAHKNARYHCADLAYENPFEKDSFDYILSFVAWEHMRHPFGVLYEATKLLTMNGSFFIRANQYRSALASHLYDVIYFPFPHLLFEDDLIVEYALENGVEQCWIDAFYYVNKLTYAKYKEYFQLLKLQIKEEWFVNRKFDFEFYHRFENKLGLYPISDLTLDFFNVILEKVGHATVERRKRESTQYKLMNGV